MAPVNGRALLLSGSLLLSGRPQASILFFSEKNKFVGEDECGELVEFTDKAKPNNSEKQAKIKKKQ
jgi:hypothetical protein